MTQPPYVWTPPIGAQRARHTRRTVITVITVLAVLVVFLAAMAGYLVWHAQDAAASVTLEPTNSATADSFMPAHGPDASVATPPGNGGGTVAGSTPGLFGGTSDNSTCDQAQMSEFLAAHPDKAEAWAEAEGVGRSDIPEYVRQLTPVLLRADTSITNHGYRDGRLTAYPAVLEAGTAVLVDGYGTPRVKCYCGNPLSAPPQQQPRHFSGTAWRHFAPVTVVVVRPAPVVVQNLTVINVQNNTVVNVHVAPWRWGPPPGWTGSPSSSSSSTSTSATDTSSVSPYSDPYGQRAGGPGTGCDPATNVPGAVTTTTGTCPSTSTTTPTTTTTTPTTTTTTTTTTEPTTTTTTTSGSVN